MFLSELLIENFRIFGPEANQEHLRMRLLPGLNVLVGENDSGKTAVVDAVRHLLWTTGSEYHRLTEDDFHVSGTSRSSTLRISCVFAGLSTEDAGRFLEWLSVDDEGNPQLCITLQATRLEDTKGHGRGKGRIAVTVRSGKKADGPAIEGEIREFLKVTYLRPLRDAEGELAAGRGSRLAQILASHKDFRDQGTSDFDPDDESGTRPETLAGIMHQAEHLITKNPVVEAATKQLNEQYLEELSVGDETLRGSIGVARSTELRQILEKLELWLDPPGDVGLRTPRGLGANNVLFMATELLLLDQGAAEALPFLLIEEPEAHLHPQMQLRLMAFLDKKCTDREDPVQVLLTTHSPNLASKVDLESITLMHRGRVFALDSDSTKLDRSDCRFLRRFLDVTKANLFFAKGVAIVEGDAENVLLPVIAELLDRSFSKHGVSVVNVGSRGLFRYARIFQRRDGQAMPVRVACLADRDIPPAAASYVPKRTNRDGEDLPTHDTDFTPDDITKKVEAIKARDEGAVRTFVSPAWTLEYDLALGDLALDVYVAVQLAKKAKGKADFLSGLDILQTVCGACRQFREWRDEGENAAATAARIYEPLYGKSASKAETASFLAEVLPLAGIDACQLRAALPEYIVDAIDYVTGQEALGEDTDAADD